MNRETKNRSHPSLATTESTDNRLEIFYVLYPIFKEEVFKRREQMIWLITFASAFLLVLLVTLPALMHWSTQQSPASWLAISGVALFSGLCAYLILQHAERHRMAKQQLIALEQALGFYQEGWQPNGEALFPKNWQSDWSMDHSVRIYLTILAAFTIMVFCAILVQL